MYETDGLIQSVTVRGLLPTARVDLTGSDILMFANEEMQNDLVQAVLSVREDYYVSYKDFPMPADDSTEMQIPSRAIGNKLRNVMFIDGAGNYTPVARRQIEDASYTNVGYYVMNNGIRLLNRTGSGHSAVRMYFYLRPNMLVDVTQRSTVSSVSGSSIVLTSVPSSFQTGLKYDIIQANPNFGTLVWDATGSIIGNTLTLTGGNMQPGTALSSLPTSISVGDRVCLAGQSSVIQLPLEFHVVLAQAVIVKALEAEGDLQGMQVAQAKLIQYRKNAVSLISNRTESSPKYIVNNTGMTRQFY